MLSCLSFTLEISIETYLKDTLCCFAVCKVPTIGRSNPQVRRNVFILGCWNWYCVASTSDVVTTGTQHTLRLMTLYLLVLALLVASYADEIVCNKSGELNSCSVGKIMANYSCDFPFPSLVIFENRWAAMKSTRVCRTRSV